MRKSPSRPASKKKKKVSYDAQLQKTLSPKTPRKISICVTWNNTQGLECKRIIEPNRCFCSHSFELHENSKTIGAAYCLAPGCKCKCFEYIPYYDIKCMCRHSYKDHDRNTKMCKMCNKCLGFVTNWSCKCGFRYDMHETVFQLRDSAVVEPPPAQEEKPENNKSYIAQLDLTEHDKENSHAPITFRDSLDALTYEMNKYGLRLNVDSLPEKKLDTHKKRQIQRINQKYSGSAFEKQLESSQLAKLSPAKIEKPDNVHAVTPLQLYIRPHNYQIVRLEKLLFKQYQKYEK